MRPGYPRPADDLERASDPPPGGHHALLTLDAQAVGYLRWQYVDRATRDSLGLAQNTLEFRGHRHPGRRADLTGKGIGPTALNLLADLLRVDPSVPRPGLTSSVANARAHRGFPKARFQIALQYDPNGLGPWHLLLRDLRPER